MIRSVTVTLFCLYSGAIIAQLQPLEFKKEFVNDSIYLSVKNTLPAPVKMQLRCDTVNADLNLLLSPGVDFIEILKLPDILENDSAELSPFLELSAQVGDPNAKHNADYLYQLPFETGKSYELIQGFKGKFSHRSDHSRYALDFKMDVGEPIHAAREGVICYFQDEFSTGGRDRTKYFNKGNRIMILHPDGTIATYNHLVKDGVLVELGQKVKKGDLIGLSGNTGFTTTPHLHFVVRSGETSVKFKMENVKKLKTGRKYGR